MNGGCPTLTLRIAHPTGNPSITHMQLLPHAPARQVPTPLDTIASVHRLFGFPLVSVQQSSDSYSNISLIAIFSLVLILLTVSL